MTVEPNYDWLFERARAVYLADPDMEVWEFERLFDPDMPPEALFKLIDMTGLELGS